MGIKALVEWSRILRFVFDELRVITACVQASTRVRLADKEQICLNLRIKVLCIVQSSLMWMSDASMPIMGQYKGRSSYDSKFSKADIRRQIKLFNVKYASSWIKHPKSAQSKFTTTMEELTAFSFRGATGHFQQPLKFLIEAKCPFSARTMTIKEACANVGISLLVSQHYRLNNYVM
ncbi:uncharacterized protein LOC125681817 isoform X3 [Ostrea edulis]|uniref:uncharacterized protein LOC125681817 isoform X3 n=1 Tax=Ostrea edulis TaxID=37623 RepID=UPI0024AE99A2|nr:uncharacterized protein LOC125681817 isoform X3 [Ostrea edulis]